MTYLELSCPKCGKLPSQHSKLDCSMRFVQRWEDSEYHSPLAKTQERVMDVLSTHGIMTREDLLRYVFRQVTDDQLTQILMILERAGIVSIDGPKIIWL